MKLLANENFPLDSVRFLAAKGYDVKAVGVHFAGVTDQEVMNLAEQERRIILTFDRDYGELIFKHGFRPSLGVIYLRLPHYESEEPGRLIAQLLKDPLFETSRKLTVFDGEMIRQRKY
jgi:predicted nuclease of predicted toxin-antitoxin system